MRISKEILGEELYIKIKGKLGDKKIIIDDENYIPRSRLNQVIYEKNIFRKNIETLTKKLDDMKESMNRKERFIERLENSNKELVQENATIKDICFNNSIKLEALKMNAKNIHVASILVDKSKLEILEDGTVKGLDEQLKELKETKRDLFGEDILVSLMDIQESVGNLIQRKLMENL